MGWQHSHQGKYVLHTFVTSRAPVGTVGEVLDSAPLNTGKDAKASGSIRNTHDKEQPPWIEFHSVAAAVKYVEDAVYKAGYRQRAHNQHAAGMARKYPIACPTCKAPRGQACVSKTNNTLSKPHVSRNGNRD